MNHYTFNSGHSRVSPRSEVSDAAIDALTDFTKSGEHDFPYFGGFRLVTDSTNLGVLATLYTVDKVPIVTIGVVRDEKQADELWPQLEALYHRITELPGHRAMDWKSSKRPNAPWCSVVIIAPIPLSWVGDFERCFAWAWLEKNRG